MDKVVNMRERVRESDSFRYNSRWGDRDGGHQRRWYGKEGGGTHVEGEIHNVRGVFDQEGWQLVQHRRARKGTWRGGKTVDIASRTRNIRVENKDMVSFFFSNFPKRYTARDMYHIFSEHGRVIEVFISGRKDVNRKRFGFVRFMNVTDPDRMAIRLDNIFVKGVEIHVNLPKYNRAAEPKPKQTREAVFTAT